MTRTAAETRAALEDVANLASELVDEARRLVEDDGLDPLEATARALLDADPRGIAAVAHIAILAAIDPPAPQTTQRRLD